MGKSPNYLTTKEKVSRSYDRNSAIVKIQSLKSTI